MSQVAQLPTDRSTARPESSSEKLIPLGGEYRPFSPESRKHGVQVAFSSSGRGPQVAFEGERGLSMTVGRRYQMHPCMLCPLLPGEFVTFSLPNGRGGGVPLKFRFVGLTSDKKAVRILPC